jgi:hypothetical protein
MFNLHDFYTGIKTPNGEKVYLGDKITGDFYFPMLVQYDFEQNKYILSTIGKTKSPYRSYEIIDVPKMQGLRVISNTLIYPQFAQGEQVRITVKNIKESIFGLGETVTIVKVNEWEVVAISLDGKRKTSLQFHEFLPLWRWDN